MLLLGIVLAKPASCVVDGDGGGVNVRDGWRELDHAAAPRRRITVHVLLGGQRVRDIGRCAQELALRLALLFQGFELLVGYATDRSADPDLLLTNL